MLENPPRPGHRWPPADSATERHWSCDSSTGHQPPRSTRNASAAGFRRGMVPSGVVAPVAPLANNSEISFGEKPPNSARIVALVRPNRTGLFERYGRPVTPRRPNVRVFSGLNARTGSLDRPEEPAGPQMRICGEVRGVVDDAGGDAGCLKCLGDDSRVAGRDGSGYGCVVDRRGLRACSRALQPGLRAPRLPHGDQCPCNRTRRGPRNVASLFPTRAGWAPIASSVRAGPSWNTDVS